MTRYTVLIDGEAGGYGVVFPDLPGCAAMGTTIESALGNAADALRDWVEVTTDEGGVAPSPTPLEILRTDPGVRQALAEGATLQRSARPRHRQAREGQPVDRRRHPLGARRRGRPAQADPLRLHRTSRAPCAPGTGELTRRAARATHRRSGRSCEQHRGRRCAEKPGKAVRRLRRFTPMGACPWLAT